MHSCPPEDVLRLGETDISPVLPLFAVNELELIEIEPGIEIPGSHWGDCEAGLIEYQLFARADTPVHSLLHEACHFFLMNDVRRQNLHTDAGGSSVEENAVCYLQIVIASLLPQMGMHRMMFDMDTWGYSFRLGSARAWFDEDAEDAIQHLQQCGFLVKACVNNQDLKILEMFKAQRRSRLNSVPE